MGFIDEHNQVGPLLQLAQHVLDAILEHPAQHRARHHAVHLEVDDLAVAQPDGQRLGVELDSSREAFGDRGLPDAGLADQHHRVRALPVAENLDDLLNLGVPAEDGRSPILTGEQIQVRREVLQERRQLEPLLETLVADFDVAHPVGDARDQQVRLDALTAQHRDRHSLRLLEDGGEEVP